MCFAPLIAAIASTSLLVIAITVFALHRSGAGRHCARLSPAPRHLPLHRFRHARRPVPGTRAAPDALAGEGRRLSCSSATCMFDQAVRLDSCPRDTTVCRRDGDRPRYLGDAQRTQRRRQPDPLELFAEGAPQLHAVGRGLARHGHHSLGDRCSTRLGALVLRDLRDIRCHAARIRSPSGQQMVRRLRKAAPDLPHLVPDCDRSAVFMAPQNILVPDSDISMFFHRSGNMAVLAAIGIAFLWMADGDAKLFTTRQRAALTTLATFVIVFTGLQNRGGMVASAVLIAALLFLLSKKRIEMVVMMIAVLVFAGAIGIIFDVRIALFDERDVSIQQFADNVTSIFNQDAGGQRQKTTTTWRLKIWTQVLNDVSKESPIIGFGMGPDIGARYGITTDDQTPLRNPHNSHVDVLARMGGSVRSSGSSCGRHGSQRCRRCVGGSATGTVLRESAIVSWVMMAPIPHPRELLLRPDSRRRTGGRGVMGLFRRRGRPSWSSPSRTAFRRLRPLRGTLPPSTEPVSADDRAATCRGRARAFLP